MTRLLVLSALGLAACGGGATSDDEAPVAGVALEVPTDPPAFGSGSGDLRDTLFGYPRQGSATFDVQMIERDGATTLDEDLDMVESRSWEIVDGSLTFDGARMRDVYSLVLRRSEDGWVCRYNPFERVWVRLWAANPEPGDHWTALVTWYDLDPTVISLFPGQYELVGHDVEAPNGVTGTTHLRSTFSEDGYEGVLDEYFVPGEGAVYEERRVTRPDGTEQVAVSARR